MSSVRNWALKLYFLWSALGLAISLIAHIALYFVEPSKLADLAGFLFYAGLTTELIITVIPWPATDYEIKVLKIVRRRRVNRSNFAVIAFIVCYIVYIITLSFAYILSNYRLLTLPIFISAMGWSSGAFVSTSISALFYFSAFDSARIVSHLRRCRRTRPRLTSGPIRLVA